MLQLDISGTADEQVDFDLQPVACEELQVLSAEEQLSSTRWKRDRVFADQLEGPESIWGI